MPVGVGEKKSLAGTFVVGVIYPMRLAACGCGVDSILYVDSTCL
jgi:hypothetical protein